MSSYQSDFKKLQQQLKEMRQRLARREQADQQRLNTANPNRRSAVQRDIQKAQARQQRAQDKFSSEHFQGRPPALPAWAHGCSTALPAADRAGCTRGYHRRALRRPFR